MLYTLYCNPPLTHAIRCHMQLPVFNTILRFVDSFLQMLNIFHNTLGFILCKPIKPVLAKMSTNWRHQA
jgi:hypothetical protein